MSFSSGVSHAAIKCKAVFEELRRRLVVCLAPGKIAYGAQRLRTQEHPFLVVWTALQREQVLQPDPALLQVAAYLPEQPQGCRQAQSQVKCPALHRPAEHRAQ